MAKFVVEAIFAGDERHLEGEGDIAAGLGGADQGAENFGAVGVSPAEVIEQGNARWVRADGDDVADGFIDGEARHVIRIEIAVMGINAAPDGEAPPRTVNRHDDGSIPGTVVGGADEGLDDRAAL